MYVLLPRAAQWLSAQLQHEIAATQQNLLLKTCCALLVPVAVQKVRGSTGFTPVEVFRKYLWFLLRERQFDIAAVQDMVLLKQALGLTDDEVRRGWGVCVKWGVRVAPHELK